MNLHRLKSMLTVDDSILESPFALADPCGAERASADPAQARGQRRAAACYVGGRLRLARMRVTVGEQMVASSPSDAPATRTTPVRRVYARKDVQPFSYAELRSRARSVAA
ncbi:MAG: hypothetical protein OWT27_05590, partial [Firmicutes bacterium]|nr:hypothetical protein [Bacillota bacterium]